MCAPGSAAGAPGIVGDARDQDRDVVVGKPRSKGDDRLVDDPRDVARRPVGEAAEQVAQPLLAEHVAAVAPLGHAVRPERHEVAEPERARHVVVGSRPASTPSSGPHSPISSTTPPAARTTTGGGWPAHAIASAVPVGGRAQDGQRRRAELLGRALGADRVVDDGEDAAGRLLVAAHDAHGLARQAGQRSRRRPVAGDVADRQEVAVAGLPGRRRSRRRPRRPRRRAGSERRPPCRAAASASPGGGSAAARARCRARRRRAARSRSRARRGARDPRRPPDPAR